MDFANDRVRTHRDASRVRNEGAGDEERGGWGRTWSTQLSESGRREQHAEQQPPRQVLDPSDLDPESVPEAEDREEDEERDEGGTTQDAR